MLAKIIMVGNLVFYKSLAAKPTVMRRNDRDAPKTKPSALNEQKETRYETH